MKKITPGMEFVDNAGQVWVIAAVRESYVLVWGKTFCAEEKLTWARFEAAFIDKGRE